MNVEASAPPSLGARFGARVVDYVLLGMLGGGLGRVSGFGFGWLAGTALGVYAYFVVGDAFFGKTVGKALVGLRVVDERGEKPSLVAAAKRELFVIFGAVPFVGPLLALAAWIGIVVTARKSAVGEGWHDRIAGGTRVTRA
ncbi:MAG TPA: RDD family protein [Polyangiaceae bacterium]